MAFSRHRRSPTIPPRTTSFSRVPHTHPRRLQSISCSRSVLNEGQVDGKNENESKPSKLPPHQTSNVPKVYLTEDQVRRGLGLAVPKQAKDRNIIIQEPAPGEFCGRYDHVLKARSNSAEFDRPAKYRPTLDTISSVPSSQNPTNQSSPHERHIPIVSGNHSTPISIPIPVRPDKVEQDARTEENESHSGTVRRRRMRTVSRDDHLVIRGANPRTGVITPGSHSAASSLDDTGSSFPMFNGGSNPTKWRQRGNEWVSLASDQPTPVESPLETPRKLVNGRPLRTPPRLTASRFNPSPQQKPSSLTDFYKPPNDSRAQSLNTPGYPAIPGTYPVPPMKDTKRQVQQPTTEPTIKRKPVATPVVTAGESGLPDVRASSQHNSIRAPFHTDQLRSSSAPAPRRREYFSPDDIGSPNISKDLPALPNTAHRANPPIPATSIRPRAFLGPWPAPAVWVEDIPASLYQNHKRDLPPKCQPDPQMNIGPYQSRPNRAQFPSGNAATMPHRATRGPRGGDPDYPYIRTRPRFQRMGLAGATGAHDQAFRLDGGQDRLRHSEPRQQRVGRREQMGEQHPRVLYGPRRMGRSLDLHHTTADVFTEHLPSNTTMSTGITTPTFTDTKQMSERQGRLRPEDSDNLNDTLTQHAHQVDRPTMPGRSLGMRHVPKARAKVHREDEADMVSLCRGKMDGMTPDQDIGIRGERNRRLRDKFRPQDRRVNSEDLPDNSSATHPAVWMDGTGQPTTTECSRCRNGFVSTREDGIRNTGGHILMSDQRRCWHCRREVEHERRDTGEDGGGELSARTHNFKASEMEYSPGAGLTQTASLPAMTIAASSSKGRSQDMPLGDSGRESGRSGVSTNRSITPDNIETPLQTIVELYADGDQRDHSACCSDCCELRDCHTGCLGHPGSVTQEGTPRGTTRKMNTNIKKRTVEREVDPELASGGSETTVVDETGASGSDTSSQCAASPMPTPETPGAALARHTRAFRTRVVQFARTIIRDENDRCDPVDSPTPWQEKKGHAGKVDGGSRMRNSVSPLATPNTFWGGDGAGQISQRTPPVRARRLRGNVPPGSAADAARKALSPGPPRRTVNGPVSAAQHAIDTLGIHGAKHDDELTFASEFDTSRTDDTRRRRKVDKHLRSATMPVSVPIRVRAANEGRRLAATGRRHTSGASDSDDEKNTDTDTDNDLTSSPTQSEYWDFLVALYRLASLPLRSGWIYVQRHPEVADWVNWIVGVKMMEMVHVIMNTIQRMGSLVEGQGIKDMGGEKRDESGRHVHGKGGAPELMLDIGRSVVYIGVFLTLGMMVGRAVGMVWWCFGSVGWVARGLMWVLRSVLFGS